MNSAGNSKSKVKHLLEHLLEGINNWKVGTRPKYMNQLNRFQVLEQKDIFSNNITTLTKTAESIDDIMEIIRKSEVLPLNGAQPGLFIQGIFINIYSVRMVSNNLSNSNENWSCYFPLLLF